MDGSWALIAVGLVGLLVGAAAALAFRWSERSHAREPEVAKPAVSYDVAALLSALRSTSVLLGPGGEVLRASPDAYATGLVRNGRLTHATLNDLVAATRADGQIRDEHLEVPRSAVPGADRLSFEVRVATMAGGRVLLLADDQTAQRRLEEVRRDFVANVSHELKTPVGAIALLAETAADAADDPELVRRFAGKMQREAVRLSALVQEIIELSRLQAPDNEVGYVDVSVDGVVTEAVDRIRVEAESREITVVVGGTTGLHVLGDHALLVTAVRNLLDNALRYSDNGTRVSVGVRPRDGIAEIAVVDQGPGISSENAGRVFERFFRVDPARSRDTGGTGLGLSIVKHVAQNHGGEVTLWSAPGRGSTFTLRIPLADDSSDGGAPSRDEKAPPTSAGAGGETRDPHPAR
ncbi:two-component sensor histidine kinase [Occultella glacieicola]|uniref:Sensor-like histidine kinase SenX3 n=1 Tax=Occultella glacieicola TaxID=2518684 RepID=A0ABY2E3P0_9MICO|nr:ATP-binding protein [Occultella glacieicola]TDE94241.1 two-component sensor histidine kinase [Occultella glacieicola]